MFRLHSALAVFLLKVALPGDVLATTLACENEAHSSSKLAVRVPESSYEAFAQLIQSGDVVPVSPHLVYGGGIESDRVKTWSLLNGNYTIGVYVDYIKKSKEFEFWVQTCGTTESWRPYWHALTQRIKSFPGATIDERELHDCSQSGDRAVVDEHQPGFVECRLMGASGALHTFLEKVPVVTDKILWPDSKYPCPGAIACRLDSEFGDSAGRQLVRIDTEQPHGVESTLGESSFVVLSSQVISQ